MIYIARLPCSCVIDANDNEYDLFWFYLMRGNGWTVERVEKGQKIEYECAACREFARAHRKRQTVRMF